MRTANISLRPQPWHRTGSFLHPKSTVIRIGEYDSGRAVPSPPGDRVYWQRWFWVIRASRPPESGGRPPFHLEQAHAGQFARMALLSMGCRSTAAALISAAPNTEACCQPTNEDHARPLNPLPDEIKDRGQVRAMWQWGDLDCDNLLTSKIEI
jgi:hypothetical protein